jgi:hypothetical protein
MPARQPETLALVWPEPAPRTMTGAVELRLAMALDGAMTRPERVGAVIGAVFDALDGQAVTDAMIRHLSTGSRAWLLACAAAVTGAETGWFQADCQSCGAPFDFALRLADIPRGDAGPDFPVAQVETSLGPRSFEVPNGAHEAVLAQHRDGDPRYALVALLGLADTARDDAAAFSEADLAAIDEALDTAAPDIGDRVTVTCPDCGAVTGAAIDPLLLTRPQTTQVLRETHLIARAYGWREGAILSLPSDRRRAYARLIAGESRAGGAG